MMFQVVPYGDGTYWTVGIDINLAVFVTHLSSAGAEIHRYDIGGLVSDMPSIATDGTTVIVTARNASDHLCTNVWSGSTFGGWTDLGGAYVHPVVTG